MYENVFAMLDKQVTSIAIPDLAKAIEFGESKERILEIITEALTPHRGIFDVLILACTHYPLVMDTFASVVGSDVTLFDPAIAVAERAQKLFWPQEVGNGTTTFIVSQESAQFEVYVKTLFPDSTYNIEIL
jgi:glutamate racemase